MEGKHWEGWENSIIQGEHERKQDKFTAMTCPEVF